jgi:modulator of FtsH protease HflK
MAWNKPGAGNDKDPWTGNPKKNPPDLEANLRKLRKQLMQWFNQRGATPPRVKDPMYLTKILPIFIIASLFIWFFMGVFNVKTHEQAVITRFGRYVKTLGPGLHWIPKLIEERTIINRDKIETYTFTQDVLAQGDRVGITCIIRYQIADAFKFLFLIKQPLFNLKQRADAAVSEVIGQQNLSRLFSYERATLSQTIQAKLQDNLSGIKIIDVTLQPPQIPDEVRESFNRARAIRADLIQQKHAVMLSRTQEVSEEKRRCSERIDSARRYNTKVVTDAKTQVYLFLKLLPYYQKNSELTLLYLKTKALEEILMSASKLLVGNDIGNNTCIPLNQSVTQSTSKVPSERLPKPALKTANPEMKHLSREQLYGGGYE